MNKTDKEVLIIYVPVLHKGYIEFFQRYSGKIEEVWVIGEELLKKLNYLNKEIRALKPRVAAVLIRSLGLFRKVSVLTPRKAERFPPVKIVSPNERVSRKLIKKYFPGHTIFFDCVFLRWDEKRVFSKTPIDNVRISNNDFDRKMMGLAQKEAKRSSDWWRRIGAVLVKGSRPVLKAHNAHLPSEHTPYINGDPRDFIKAGKRSDLSSSVHSEQALLIEALKKGVNPKGSSIYITTFPCPVCSKLIALSGIKRCFFSSGYSSLDGRNVMEANGVELIRVK